TIATAEAEQDEQLLTPSLEGGIFGVLFCLSQEKSQQHIRHRWILLKVLLDAWQIFTTIVTPSYGWHINSEAVWWRIVGVLNFDWLSHLVVRGFSYVFIQVFDITSLSFLQIGFSCNYFGTDGSRLHMALFPSYSCTVAPQLIHAVSSAALLLLFVGVAMLVNMSEVEVNPTSMSPMALGHSGAEMTAFGIKALMTLVGVFLGWPKVASGAYLLLAMGLAWQYLRWAPHLVHWVNCLKSGVGVAMVGVAALQLAVTLAPARLSRALTLAMGASLGPLFVAGAGACWLRMRSFRRAVHQAFSSNNDAEGVPKDAFPFASPRDVEIACRRARKWTDRYELDKAGAETVAKFPCCASPFAALVPAVLLLGTAASHER
ncbi:hypothetical protein TSOC_007980, partial [Tetrabaena socialis]